MQLKIRNKATLFSIIGYCFTGIVCAQLATPTPEQQDTGVSTAILRYINEYRQQQGLVPLKMNQAIVNEAQKHSIDMAKHRTPFGHQYFMQRVNTLHHLLKDSNAAAENVAYNYKSAQDVVKNWLISPGHKKNIIGNYTMTGIGVARDDQGKMYFTQIFLRLGNNEGQSRSAWSKHFHLF